MRKLEDYSVRGRGYSFYKYMGKMINHRFELVKTIDLGRIFWGHFHKTLEWIRRMKMLELNSLLEDE